MTSLACTRLAPCILIAALATASTSRASQVLDQDQDPDAGRATIFSLAAWPQQIAGKAPSAGETPVLVHQELLAVAEPGLKLSLGVAPHRFDGTVTNVEVRLTGQSVFGAIDDDPAGFFILTSEGDVTLGVLQSARVGRLYELRYVGDGVNAWAPIDASQFPAGDCATGLRPHPVLPPDRNGPAALEPGEDRHQHEEEQNNGEIASSCNPPRHFDVAIYYTTAAKNECGGTAAIQARCQLAVDTANQVYADSLISPRMVLVFRGETSYVETSDVETDRNRLADPSDGYLDGAHSTRDAYGADFVCLFVNASDPDNCGIAYCTPSDSSYGFCVVQQGCAVGNLTFPHEVGHLQGCAHNPEDAGSCNEYCDSYGHRFTGASGSKWRTVMSYNDANNPSTRIGIFSNPYVNFDGRPTGIRTEDCDDDRFNAATVNTTAPDRENYRRPKFEVWVDFSELFGIERGTFQSPWNTLAEGVSAIYSGNAPLVEPTLWLKAGTSHETMTINKRMTIRSCGVAIIGG
ncbi:MAG: M12 family metallo-peptidase [Phycisphaerae bacterium]|nr:hypothetical protein [Phycisphaerae bacterium]MCZ2401490.1 M12 family metallo-peptidase [Phycisphaerae bacterium]NUQ48668.1 hypothetical protein [Phycisphaerae bacterium]